MKSLIPKHQSQNPASVDETCILTHVHTDLTATDQQLNFFRSEQLHKTGVAYHQIESFFKCLKLHLNAFTKQPVCIQVNIFLGESNGRIVINHPSRPHYHKIFASWLIQTTQHKQPIDYASNTPCRNTNLKVLLCNWNRVAIFFEVARL